MPSPARSLLFLAAATLSAATAVPHDHDSHDHDHALNTALPSRWYQDEDHPVHALFRRATTDGVTYPPVGSQEWAAGFPDKVDPNALPLAWVNAYNQAKNAGKIPSNVPVSTQPNGGNPTYGNLDPNGQVVCSTTYKCRNNSPDVVWDAPDGVFASSFDDGPLPASQPLYEFLHENNVTSTHFLIGTNILYNPNEFAYCWNTLGGDLAVHTWTHPYMTTLSDLAVLGELAWTMEIIHNSTGGRLPKYWRPPYGDADNRVVAIAKEVLGLTTVIWNQDTEDWSVGEATGTTRENVDQNLQKWISAPKSPGLVILEHELTNDTVGAFIQVFPLIAQNGWKFESLARMDGGAVYQNSADANSTLIPATVGAPVSVPASSSSSTSSSSRSSASSAANNAAQTTSAKSSQATGASASTHNGAVARFFSPVFAGIATFLSVVGTVFVLP
ncbi:glycoside hydrolase/deacetylase [Ganoderma leucocontextum]|nr:glycoside hydrolase/deacetylase [Ganoderma leucocontextum]